MDSKAEHSALSGTRSQKKKLKQTDASAPLNLEENNRKTT